MLVIGKTGATGNPRHSTDVAIAPPLFAINRLRSKNEGDAIDDDLILSENEHAFYKLWYFRFAGKAVFLGKIINLA